MESFTVSTPDGKVLLSGNGHHAGVAYLSLPGLGSGVYVLTIIDTDNQAHTYKILKR